MQELQQIMDWMEESIPSIRKRDVKKFYKETDMLEVAYKASIALQSIVTNFKPLTTGCCSVGSLLTLGHLEGMTEKQRELFKFRNGWHAVDVLCERGLFSIYKGKKRLSAIVKLEDARKEISAQIKQLEAMDEQADTDELKAKIKEINREIGRDPYVLKVNRNKKEFVERLFEYVNTHPIKEIPVYSRPLLIEPDGFESFYHDVYGELVRKANPDVIWKFIYEDMPEVYDAINKQIKTALDVNRPVLEIYDQIQDDDVFTLKRKNVNDEQLEGMLREFKGTLDICRGTAKHKMFWQSLFYGMRNRSYVSSVYFSTQGSKLSKSLIKLYAGKALGERGWRRLLIHTTNCWGEDKLTLDKRFQWALDNMDEWMKWANDPVNYKEERALETLDEKTGKVIEEDVMVRPWTEADDHFGFLASILEIKAALDSGDKYSYVSNLITAWDATCSGLQILSALTLDENGGKMSNLTDCKDVGDYYGSIRDEVFGMYDSLDDEGVRSDFKALVDTMEDLADSIKELEGSEDKDALKQAKDLYRVFMRDNYEQMIKLSHIYWIQEEIRGEGRGICKRPGMTFFYSCGAKTMAAALFKDHITKFKFRNLKRNYCTRLAKDIYDACIRLMPKPYELMMKFIELGVAEFKKGNDFEMTLPNGFIVKHYYRDSEVQSEKVMHKGKRMRLRVYVGKNNKLDYTKIYNAIAPNIVHALDGQLVANIHNNKYFEDIEDYPKVTIHDSFGCLAADADQLNDQLRHTFVKMFENDMLAYIMNQFPDFECDITEGGFRFESCN